ncbi:variable surface lipoprotein [Metamycoplasma canadense]|uniref:Uncharacterized protein n=1 Tax=Metamycoplasma canadense TaxID=29554 RepID=A0A077LB17_9BACT|nr:variable surface lipoprotein [Metamycoplasma canadense]BAP39384.1 hypothetical protein MCAN360_0106 [Metamycoplasma canadense]
MKKISRFLLTFGFLAPLTTLPIISAACDNKKEETPKENEELNIPQKPTISEQKTNEAKNLYESVQNSANSFSENDLKDPQYSEIKKTFDEEVAKAKKILEEAQTEENYTKAKEAIEAAKAKAEKAVEEAKKQEKTKEPTSPETTKPSESEKKEKDQSPDGTSPTAPEKTPEDKKQVEEDKQKKEDEPTTKDNGQSQDTEVSKKNEELNKVKTNITSLITKTREQRNGDYEILIKMLEEALEQSKKLIEKEQNLENLQKSIEILTAAEKDFNNKKTKIDNDIKDLESKFNNLHSQIQELIQNNKANKKYDKWENKFQQITNPIPSTGATKKDFEDVIRKLEEFQEEITKENSQNGTMSGTETTK